MKKQYSIIGKSIYDIYNDAEKKSTFANYETILEALIQSHYEKQEKIIYSKIEKNTSVLFLVLYPDLTADYFIDTINNYSRYFDYLAVKDGIDLIQFDNGNIGFVAYYNGHKSFIEIITDKETIKKYETMEDDFS